MATKSNDENIDCNIDCNIDGSSDDTPEPSLEPNKKIESGKLRIRVVDELIKTEKTYVECLDNLIRHFMIPLQNKINGKQLLSMTEHSTIFPNDINTIYGFHGQLLVELAKTTSNWNNDTSKIGNIFVKYGQLFKMYQNYMNNHEKAASCLSSIIAKNAKFAEWCTNTRDKCNNYGLDSLLILPIQRIPRYQLLLKELIKRTEEYDEYHLDLYDLRNAYDQITEVTQCINERMKENDRRQKVGLIETRFDRSLIDKIGENLVTPARYFIAESSENVNDEDYIIKHNKHGTQSHIVLFVFNDCVIYGHYDNSIVSPTKSSPTFTAKNKKRNSLHSPNRAPTTRKTVKNLLWNRDLLKFDHMMSFDALFCLEDVAEHNYNNLFCLKVYGRQHSLWISFKTKECKFKWMTLLIETNDKANSRTIKSPINTDMIDIPYPVFIPDDYSDKCLICKSKFTMLNRRHHCYYCGTLACAKCTDFRLTNAWKKNEIVRVCNVCHGKYKDKSGDVPVSTLPSNQRASVWEASQGYNLNDYQPESNIVPIISPSVSPEMKSVNEANSPNTPPPVMHQMGTTSAINDLVNQQQTKRTSFRRRKMSENKQKTKITETTIKNENTLSIEEVTTSPSGTESSFAMITKENSNSNTADTMNTDIDIVEIKKNDIIIKDDENKEDLEQNEDESVTELMKNKYFENDQVIQEKEDDVVVVIEDETVENKINDDMNDMDDEKEEKHEIEDKEIKNNKMDEIEMDRMIGTENDEDKKIMNINMDKMIGNENDESNMNQNILIIGGIVVVGIALIVALHRRSF